MELFLLTHTCTYSINYKLYFLSPVYTAEYFSTIKITFSRKNVSCGTACQSICLEPKNARCGATTNRFASRTTGSWNFVVAGGRDTAVFPR